MPEGKTQKKVQKEKNKKIKNTIVWIIIFIIIAGVIVWAVTLPKKDKGEIISSVGIHEHAQIFISVNGEDIIVPFNIGLLGVQRGMHTHKEDNMIHIEKGGVVRESDITVGTFFDIWGKDFSQTSLLDNINGEEGTVRMFVNDEENFEFEKYQMQNGDVVRIVYE